MTGKSPVSDNIVVLMSTYNGSRYIKEQLASIYSQKGVSCSLLVRDDGSSDDTCSILEKEQCDGKLKWYSGTNLGPAMSFLDLLKHAPKADYYAFSDQDDIWDNQKLKAAVDMINKEKKDIPVMYYSDLNVVDKDGSFIRKANTWEGSIDKYKISVFIGIRGCTMVYNYHLQALLQKYSPRKISGHDTYIALLAFWAGHVVYDSNAYIDYRQTGENLSITGKSSFDRLKKNFLYVKKRLTVRANIHENNAKEIIKGYENIIDVENLKAVAFYRNSLSSKIKLLKKKEYFHFSFLINLFNLLFIIIGKL